MRKNTSASGWRALASKYWAITGVAPAGSGIKAAGAFIAAQATEPAPARQPRLGGLIDGAPRKDRLRKPLEPARSRPTSI